MKCPSCGTECTDPYCTGCGAELTQLQPQTETGQGGTGPALAAPKALPVITVSYGGRDFPLVRGAKMLIARKGGGKCTPELEIDSENVSSTPIEISVDDSDKVMIRDTGTSNGIRVVKALRPGESIEGQPGEMIMAGKDVIITLS